MNARIFFHGHDILSFSCDVEALHAVLDDRRQQLISTGTWLSQESYCCQQVSFFKLYVYLIIYLSNYYERIYLITFCCNNAQ